LQAISLWRDALIIKKRSELWTLLASLFGRVVIGLTSGLPTSLLLLARECLPYFILPHPISNQWSANHWFANHYSLPNEWLGERGGEWSVSETGSRGWRHVICQ